MFLILYKIELFFIFVVIVLFQIMILSSSSRFKRYRCRDVVCWSGFISRHEAHEFSPDIEL